MSETFKNLVDEFGTQFPTLDEVAEKYLMITPKEARKRYHKKELPFPVMVLGTSTQAVKRVNMIDFCVYLDHQSLIAREQM